MVDTSSLLMLNFYKEKQQVGLK